MNPYRQLLNNAFQSYLGVDVTELTDERTLQSIIDEDSDLLEIGIEVENQLVDVSMSVPDLSQVLRADMTVAQATLALENALPNIEPQVS